VKVIRPELAADPEFRRRFTSEARAAATMDHPNVVTVYDAGEDGCLFLAMALIDGGNLGELLELNGPLRADDAVAILLQVCEGLAAAHDAGLVHRDVKPANVLLTADGSRALITDFGIAKNLDGSTATNTAHLVGTLDYLAPEQIEGLTVDARTDVYAVGCVLYEALTGHVPYEREGAPARMWAKVSEAPPRASEHAAVPAAIDEVIATAMAKDPADRYQTPAALGAAARAAVEPLVITRRPFPVDRLERRRRPAEKLDEAPDGGEHV
jgi:serine/threonine-protein kinase